MQVLCPSSADMALRCSFLTKLKSPKASEPMKQHTGQKHLHRILCSVTQYPRPTAMRQKQCLPLCPSQQQVKRPEAGRPPADPTQQQAQRPKPGTQSISVSRKKQAPGAARVSR